jgi:hypothetical protein
MHTKRFEFVWNYELKVHWEQKKILNGKRGQSHIFWSSTSSNYWPTMYFNSLKTTSRKLRYEQEKKKNINNKKIRLKNLYWARDARFVMMYKISHDKVAVSKSDRLSLPRGTPEICTPSHIRSHYVGRIIFSSHHCRMESPTSDRSVERLYRVLQGCYYFI